MSDLRNHLSKQKLPYIKDLVRIYKLKTKVNLTQKKQDLINDLDKHLELKDKKIKMKVKGVAKITMPKEKPKTTPKTTPKKPTKKSEPKPKPKTEPIYDDEIQPVKKKSTPKTTTKKSTPKEKPSKIKKFVKPQL